MLRIFIATAGLFLFLSVLHLSFGYEYKFIYVLSAAALFTFCLSFSRVLYVLLLTIYLLLGLIYGAVGINYGYPDVNAVGSLMYTDNGESRNILRAAVQNLSVSCGLLVSAGCALLMKPLKNVISESYCLPSFYYRILVILKRLYSGKIGRICLGI